MNRLYSSKLKLAKSSLKSFKYLLLAISTCSLTLTYNKALAGVLRPDMATNNSYLSISYNECKAKASKVASFVFAEYLSEETNDESIFRIKGRTSESRALLVCMKENQGVHFVVIASSDGSDKEEKSIRDRVTNYMKNGISNSRSNNLNQESEPNNSYRQLLESAKERVNSD